MARKVYVAAKAVRLCLKSLKQKTLPWILLSTRLPLGAPLLASQEAPELQAATAVLFVLFLIGAALQARRIHGARTQRRPAAA